MTFSAADLATLDASEEIEVETRSPSGVVHRAIVWPVVRHGTVYLRSYKAGQGRWYREALADPEIALHVDGRRLAARAIAAGDERSIEACSEALRAKYADDESLEAMLSPETLPTTVRVEPA